MSQPMQEPGDEPSAHLDTALRQDPVAAAGWPEWISVAERLPEAGAIVLACFLTPRLKRPIIIRAMHAPHLALGTEEWGEFEPDGGEYDEVTDACYWPEGWYENNQHEETHWAVDEPVTHWMPLPPPPQPGAAQPKA